MPPLPRLQQRHAHLQVHLQHLLCGATRSPQGVGPSIAPSACRLGGAVPRLLPPLHAVARRSAHHLLLGRGEQNGRGGFGLIEP